MKPKYTNKRRGRSRSAWRKCLPDWTRDHRV